MMMIIVTLCLSTSFHADTDEDDMVTLIDATYIQRWLADLKSNDNIGLPNGYCTSTCFFCGGFAVRGSI